jgi:recombinational DNA repair protein RecR
MNEDAIRLVLAIIAEQPREVLARLEDAIRERRIALDVCEHGVSDGEYCELCSQEYRRARIVAGFEEDGV